MSSTDQIYHRAAKRRGDKFDRSITRGNNAVEIIGEIMGTCKLKRKEKKRKENMEKSNEKKRKKNETQKNENKIVRKETKQNKKKRKEKKREETKRNEKYGSPLVTQNWNEI